MTAIDIPDLAGALCAQVDPELFFPEKGGSTREAKRICRRCPIRDACLEYALVNGERFGIWGGQSERERRRLGAVPAPLPALDEPDNAAVDRLLDGDRLAPRTRPQLRAAINRLLDRGLPHPVIADHLGCSTRSVNRAVAARRAAAASPSPDSDRQEPAA